MKLWILIFTAGLASGALAQDAAKHPVWPRSARPLMVNPFFTDHDRAMLQTGDWAKHPFLTPDSDSRALMALDARVQSSHKPKLSDLEKAYKQAKAAYQRHHGNAALKHAYVVATVKYGDGSMRAAELPPKVKYRQALRLFREALKLDPQNPIAKPESDLIISIYKSMGRPVPEG